MNLLLSTWRSTPPFFYPGKAFGKHPLKLSFFFRDHIGSISGNFSRDGLGQELINVAKKVKTPSLAWAPGCPGMHRDGHRGPGTSNVSPGDWSNQWVIFQQPKKVIFSDQLNCFVFFTWLVVHDFYFPIYGMSSFPLTFICSRWLKPPTYQLNWWCFSMKNMGVSQLTWFHPEKPIGFSKARPFSWRASWGRSRKGPRRNFPRKGHGFPMGRVGGFPWGKPWKIMGNCGKMEVWMGNSLGNAGKILWSLIEVTELNGDEGFSSHGADYRKISDNILSSWILWGIWFGWFSQEIHDFGGIDI